MSNKTPKHSLISQCAVALMFLTRLPVSDRVFQNGYPSLQSALWAFPLIGVLLGIIGTASFMVAKWLSLPDSIAVVVMLGTLVLATGALHEDGLADTADGFGTYKDAKGIARIMKDSLIGSYGAVMLVLMTLLRGAAFLEINHEALLFSLMAAMATGRGFVPIALTLTPLSPHASLGKMLHKPTKATLLAVSAICALCYLLIPFGNLLTALLASMIAFVIIRQLAVKKIDGLTGDVMGTIIIVTETAFLIGYISYG